MEYQQYPDRMWPHYHFVKKSGTTVDSLVTGMTQADISNVATLYMVGSAGIYTVNTADTWAKAHTTGGEDIKYFNDYIYYTQSADMGRYGPISGSPVFNDDFWATDEAETYNSADFHGLHTQFDKIYFGNGRYVSSYDGTTSTEKDLDLPPDFEIIKMQEYPGDYMAIAAKKTDGSATPKIDEAGVFFWDGSASSWSEYVRIPDVGLYTIANKGGVLYAFHGWSDHITISYFDGRRFRPLKSVRREISAAVTAPDMNVNAIALHRDRMLIGIENEASSATVWSGGIYSWSSPDGPYPETLNFLGPLSIGAFDCKIGAVGTLGNLVYAAWEDPSASAYGVDKLDTAADFTGVWESNIMDCGRPDVKKYFKDFRINLYPLASGHSITLSYKADYASSWTAIGTANAANISTYRVSDKPFTARKVQFQLKLNYVTATGYPPPQVYSFVVKYHDLNQ
jgi:hypothetical protein